MLLLLLACLYLSSSLLSRIICFLVPTLSSLPVFLLSLSPCTCSPAPSPWLRPCRSPRLPLPHLPTYSVIPMPWFDINGTRAAAADSRTPPRTLLADAVRAGSIPRVRLLLTHPQLDMQQFNARNATLLKDACKALFYKTTPGKKQTGTRGKRLCTCAARHDESQALMRLCVC